MQLSESYWDGINRYSGEILAGLPAHVEGRWSPRRPYGIRQTVAEASQVGGIVKPTEEDYTLLHDELRRGAAFRSHEV